MRFRPCIDIHNGKVKQIVGGSLRDEGDSARTNFSSELGADYYAELYRKRRAERRAYHPAESCRFRLL